MVRWAKKHGMTVTIHTGGPSIAGSNPISAEVVLEADPHVVGHINGGTTSMSEREIDALVATGWRSRSSTAATARPRSTRCARAQDARATDRIIIGNDAPSGTGVVPLGVLRVLAQLASLGGVAPEEAVCMATGNTARVYRLPVGVIARGPRGRRCIVRRADRLRRAATALEALRAGDLFGISMVLIDGQITIGRSRNTPPAARAAEVVKGQGPAAGGH